jgi:hypothetical protein
MKTLEQEPWNYTLYERGDTLILAVLTGGVALAEVPIVLEPDEAAAYRSRGVAGLSALIAQVREHPGSFASRQVALPG